MKKCQAAYLAALVDGEGYVGLVKRKRKNGFGYEPKVVIANTNETLRDIHEEIGLGRIFVDKRNKKSKSILIWTIPVKQAKVLIERLLPYMRLKKRQAELWLQAVELNSKRKACERVTARPKLDMLYQELRNLNHRGGNDAD